MIVNELKNQVKKSQVEVDGLKSLLKNKELTKNQRRSIAAKVLGVHRRYKQNLLVTITTWALKTDSSSASKFKIEQWQKTTFGHSISNNVLAGWCDDSRGAGDRIELEISEDTTEKARELFQLFEIALKEEIDGSRLQLLKGKMLSDDMGL